MHVHGGIGPIVATWSGQVNLLWATASNFSTNDALNHMILTLKYARFPENVSMEMWGRPGRGGGAGGGGAVQDPTNIRAQRVERVECIELQAPAMEMNIF